MSIRRKNLHSTLDLVLISFMFLFIVNEAYIIIINVLLKTVDSHFFNKESYFLFVLQGRKHVVYYKPFNLWIITYRSFQFVNRFIFYNQQIIISKTEYYSKAKFKKDSLLQNWIFQPPPPPPTHLSAVIATFFYAKYEHYYHSLEQMLTKKQHRKFTLIRPLVFFSIEIICYYIYKNIKSRIKGLFLQITNRKGS